MAISRTDRKARAAAALKKNLASEKRPLEEIHREAANLPSDIAKTIEPVVNQANGKLYVSCSTKGIEKSLPVTVRPFAPVQDMFDQVVVGNKSVAYNYLMLKGLLAVMESSDPIILSEELLQSEVQKLSEMQS